MSETRENRFEKVGETLGMVTSNVGAVVLLLVVGHFLIGGLSAIKQGLVGDQNYDPRVNLPVYDSFDDKLSYGREFSKAQSSREFRPHYLWRSLPVSGQYVNVDEEGHRVTVIEPGAEPRPDAKQVYLLGGSTMWGEGSPDKDTIASHLQQILGAGYVVTNMGEIGYVSVQEYNYLLHRLTLGDRPDIVLFYDGANDGYASVYSPGEPRGIHSIEQLLDVRMHSSSLLETSLDVFRKSNYQKLMKWVGPGEGASQHWDQDIEPQIETNVSRTLAYYDEHIRQVQALGKLYGFKSYFLWQPVLFSGTRQTVQDYEQDIIEGVSPVWVHSQRRLSEAAREHFTGRSSEGVRYIGDALDTADEPIYIDWCHIGPAGNRIIAEEMARIVLGQAG